jgi:CubicO group peptidase (beta-lactamase class C family)
VRSRFIRIGFILGLVALTNRPLAAAFLDFLQPAATVEPISESSLTMLRTPQAASVYAHGYFFDFNPPDMFTGANLIPTDLYGLPWGDGLYSGTALGGAQFLDGLLVEERLLSPKTLKRMVTPTRQSRVYGSGGVGNGRYGFGTYRLSEAGRTWQGHDGAYLGYSAMGASDRSDGVTIFVATNGRRQFEGQPAVTVWHALAKAYFAPG